MSTRSRIGLQLSDGSVISIYCHFDGYPEFNGVKLVEHFNSYEKAAELIDLGDISCLWTNADWNKETLPETGPLPYSTRGEDCPPRLDGNKYNYLADGEEYAYLFTLDGEWICYHMHQFDDDKNPEIVEIPEVALAV
jgi:hypothetical protein